jgi:hypothetical protein
MLKAISRIAYSRKKNYSVKGEIINVIEFHTKV